MNKSTVALVAGTVVCLGLSVVSTKASVTRTIDAIENIGEVTYTEECKARIDRAVFCYNELDPNQDLESKITNTEEFDAAKIEYARLAIKAASVADARKKAEGYSSADVQGFVEDAREILDTYLTADQYSLVENYADITALEAEYTSGGGGASDGGEAAVIPMC